MIVRGVEHDGERIVEEPFWKIFNC
jgi:hypothetical protein